jgi:hypothetical protein
MFLKCDSSACDTVCYSILSLFTIGSIVVALSLAIYFAWNMDLTAFDTSVLVWLFVALSVSVTVLFVVFYLKCCPWQYNKLVLAVVYLLFDAALLAAIIAVFVMRSSLLDGIAGAWSPDSSFIAYLEEKLHCCGYTSQDDRDCKDVNTICHDAIDRLITEYSGWVGGILIGLFVLLTIGVIIAFYRACVKPKPRDQIKAQDIAQVEDMLNDGQTIWF